MIILLDNTVLSNFALVERTDLLREVLGEHSVTTSQVAEEFRAGITLRRLPETEIDWLPILTLSSDEEAHCQRLQRHLNAGEASCLAVSAHRSGRVLTDDRDARVLAGRMGIPISGTLGVLIQAVQTGRLTLDQADDLLSEMIRQKYRAPVKTLRELL